MADRNSVCTFLKAEKSKTEEFKNSVMVTILLSYKTTLTWEDEDKT